MSCCDLCATNSTTHHLAFPQTTLALCTMCKYILEEISLQEKCSIEHSYRIAIARLYDHILNPVGLTSERLKTLSTLTRSPRKQ